MWLVTSVSILSQYFEQKYVKSIYNTFRILYSIVW
jgi:hypothetical protein